MSKKQTYLNKILDYIYEKGLYEFMKNTRVSLKFVADKFENQLFTREILIEFIKDLAIDERGIDLKDGVVFSETPVGFKKLTYLAPKYLIIENYGSLGERLEEVGYRYEELSDQDLFDIFLISMNYFENH